MEIVQGIYCIENKLTGKKYVGASKNIVRRWYDHRARLKHQKSNQSKLQSAWIKYGATAFKFYILEIVDLKEELACREQVWMARLDTIECGMNILPGAYCPAKTGANGNLGRKHSEETKAKMRAAKVGWVVSAEHRASISRALTGKKLPLHVIEKAKKTRKENGSYAWTDEQRRKFSAARTGIPRPQEVRDKISRTVKAGWAKAREKSA